MIIATLFEFAGNVMAGLASPEIVPSPDAVHDGASAWTALDVKPVRVWSVPPVVIIDAVAPIIES
jgi:hypothetical protein